MPLWTPDQLQTAHNLCAIVRKYGAGYPAIVPELLCLGVCIQESELDDTAAGDAGQSFGPFQIYVVAHPTIPREISTSPWCDYGFWEIAQRWRETFTTLGGRATWEALDRPGRARFLEQFAPAAQGSIAWPAGLGTTRYFQALDVYEQIS